VAEELTKRRPTRVVTSDISVAARLARIWRERELLVFMVGRDLSVKYKGSALGFAWSLLNPALTVTVYYFVFQIALGNTMPGYAIYIMCGLVTWNFFQNSVLGACGSVVANSGLVKKVSFSREILALTSMGTAAVYWFFQTIILVGALILYHYKPQFPYAYLIPLGLVALVLFTAALSIFFAAVNVYFRDMQHILEVLLMAWFWGNPIVYTWFTIRPKLADHHLTWLYLANPIAPVVLLMQRALYGNPVSGKGASLTAKVKPPPPGVHYVAHFPALWYAEVFGVIIVVSAILLALALKLFGKLEGNFAEEL